MPLFRCLECRAKFEAAAPGCAACGIDPAARREDEGVVVQLVVTHFDPPTKRAGRGKGHAACDPKVKVGRPGLAFTGEPDAVNCPACKAGAEFMAAGGVSNGAVPLRVGPKK